MKKTNSSYRMSKSTKVVMAQMLNRHDQGAYKNMIATAEIISTEALNNNKRHRKNDLETESE